jgi:hypothetical protein
VVKTLEAVYEGGVLRLLDRLDVAEKAHVQVTVWLPDESTPARGQGVRALPPGAGAFDSGFTDTAEQSESLLRELAFGEDETV